MSRPWTPDRREGTSIVIVVKRRCNGCQERLGDATYAELAAAAAGLPLPDVRGECPRCSAAGHTPEQ